LRQENFLCVKRLGKRFLNPIQSARWIIVERGQNVDCRDGMILGGDRGRAVAKGGGLGKAETGKRRKGDTAGKVVLILGGGRGFLQTPKTNS